MGKVGEGGRRLQHHEEANFSRDSQINICSREWAQDHQMTTLVVMQVGEFHEHGDWKQMVEVKKRFLNLLLKQGNRNRKKERAAQCWLLGLGTSK
jgi:hypothetical protein